MKEEISLYADEFSSLCSVQLWLFRKQTPCSPQMKRTQTTQRWPLWCANQWTDHDPTTGSQWDIPKETLLSQEKKGCHLPRRGRRSWGRQGINSFLKQVSFPWTVTIFPLPEFNSPFPLWCSLPGIHRCDPKTFDAAQMEAFFLRCQESQVELRFWEQARCQWLTPVIPATQSGGLWFKASSRSYLEKNHHRKGLVDWLKV
jgi:hypothetical protein